MTESYGDLEFRNRMIDNHRDEDLCRRWDALAAHKNVFTLRANGGFVQISKVLILCH